MAIAPINNISFRNNYNNQVNFEGKKKKTNGGMQVPMTLKAIPLATLLAMSPLNTVDAQTRADHNNENVIEMAKYTGTASDRNCDILFISDDGNDTDFEKIALNYVERVKLNQTINGQKVPVMKSTVYKQYAYDLKIVNVTYKYTDGSPDEHAVQYFVTGPRSSATFVENLSTKKPISKKDGYSQSQEYQIDKKLYEYLSQYYTPVKPESRVVVIENDLFDILGW